MSPKFRRVSWLAVSDSDSTLARGGIVLHVGTVTGQGSSGPSLWRKSSGAAFWPRFSLDTGQPQQQ